MSIDIAAFVGYGEIFTYEMLNDIKEKDYDLYESLINEVDREDGATLISLDCYNETSDVFIGQVIRSTNNYCSIEDELIDWATFANDLSPNFINLKNKLCECCPDSNIQMGIVLFTAVW